MTWVEQPRLHICGSMSSETYQIFNFILSILNAELFGTFKYVKQITGISSFFLLQAYFAILSGGKCISWFFFTSYNTLVC